jgi:ATP-dependent DNA helicase DinG
MGDETAGLKWLGLSRSGFTLNYTPVEVAASLRALLERHDCAWIFTSATLAVGASFAHFIDSSGLNEPRTLSIPSPFDYTRNSLLLLPEGLPAADSPGYTESVVALLKPLLRASRGRAFLLFTSHRALRQAAELLRADHDFRLPLLVQGEAPRSRLLEEFVALDEPVLLGTSSFWEGVDIRGSDLVLVAIDKLPFASPGDPFMKARLAAIRQRGGNPFADYQLPQAILALKQGVGRLIRGPEDRGVVVLCDPRLQSRGYGRSFLASLPPFARAPSLAAALAFLES